MKITETAHFRTSLKALSKKQLGTLKKQFGLLFANIFHPSLHTEKLEPKHKNIWSFRVDRNYRVIFTIPDKETILLLDIGSHDIYRKI